MKKLIMVAAMAVFGLSSAQEGFKLGAHIGVPVADAGDVSSFNLGLDAAYMWNVAPSFDLGIASGYSHFIGKSNNGYNFDDFGFIPIAASGKYRFSGSPVSLGLDLGYGISTKDGIDGGLYYQPKVAYNFSQGELYLGYQGVSNDFSVGSVNLGYNFFLK
ncbi:hypothetical protein SAMN05421793_12043 [Epilithonimonas hominis]|uniref:Outer membrane protein beta-barrel domain-containing protein n=2 Tax=Epilithonimonas hominis TaxID=420404 RepID=A0A1H6K7U7_9FLAO|nr:hypothetical protein SAMN05421793_12043 [Epilithonimonas hominis]